MFYSALGMSSLNNVLTNTSTSTSTYLINYFNNEGSVDVKKNNNVKIKED